MVSVTGSDLAVLQAHHEVVRDPFIPPDLILSLSKKEVLAR
jgi:hypothetical protein